MTEEPITPLFAYPPAGPKLRTSDLARDLSTAGVPLETALARVQQFAKNRWIHVRENGPRTSPNLFEVDDAAAACVLSALLDAGISDREIMPAAAAALYARNPAASVSRDFVFQRDGHLPRHPITRALGGVAIGEWWVFEVTVSRIHTTGERLIEADLHRVNHAFVGSDRPDATPRASIIVPVNEMVLPVIRRLQPDTRN